MGTSIFAFHHAHKSCPALPERMLLFGTFQRSSFSGVIDHLFVSTGEEHSGLAIVGALAFPSGAHLGEEEGQRSTTDLLEGDDGSNAGTSAPLEQSAKQRDGEVKHDQRLIHYPTEPAFPPIPNEIWGSDHLALGVEVALL